MVINTWIISTTIWDLMYQVFISIFITFLHTFLIIFIFEYFNGQKIDKNK
jgi:MFS superfamily sulfate permease-like transporter